VRVALVTVGDTGRLTGGYLYHARLFAGLRERDVEIEEIVLCGASPDEQERAIPRLGSSLDARSFDVVVVDALARVVCAPYLDRWREERPVVAMVHELPGVARPGESEREKEYEKPLLRADRLVCVSEHGRSILEDRDVPSERIRVVPPGHDRLPSAPEAERATGGVLRVLCVAQWIPRKGILDLVRAWTLRERPGATLELVGETDADPGYARTVRSLISASSEASIAVRGALDDAVLAAAYADADLFALPSRYEGYGIVFAEALAHGLPVLACDVGPVPALVGEEAALLVPPGDVGALSEALDLMLKNEDLRSRMSAAALIRARDLPGWDDTTSGFLEVLREVVAQHPRSGRV
jgi:glycosyltransferase involved in cell wall biosynthesis